MRVALPLLLLASAASANEPFRFAANWVAQGEHGGYYQALADGGFAACGLDVEILPGGPQINNRALLIAGKVDAYMGGNMIPAMSAIEQGIPVRTVAAHFQKEPQVLMSHPGRVESWDGLKDLSLFIAESSYATFYRWMMAEHGFTDAQRRAYTYNFAPFFADENSAVQGYVTSNPFSVHEAAGFWPDLWLIADHGFDSYSTTVEVMQRTIDERPEAVQCFVDAAAEGWVNFLYGDNSKAVAMILAHNPDMTAELVAYSIEAMKRHGIVEGGDTMDLGVGAIRAERMQRFYEQMRDAGALPEGLDVSIAYDLRFTNKGQGLARLRALKGE